MKWPHLLGRVLNIVLPAPCQICGGWVRQYSPAAFCHICWERMSLITEAGCRVCGRPYASRVRESFPSPCGYCQLKPPFFDWARASGYYEGTLAKAIQLFKFEKGTRLASPLSRWMVRSIEYIPPADLVIPVPLHFSRLREREYNQSYLLSRHISRILKYPLGLDYLQRHRATPPQIGMSARERMKNIRGAFSIRKTNGLQGKMVLLVDDVFTTGSTVSECSRVLKKQGKVEKVFVWTLARARSN